MKAFRHQILASNLVQGVDVKNRGNGLSVNIFLVE